MSKDSNIKDYYLLFLISPIMALVQSLRFRSNGAYKNIIWFFVAFYGYTFVISDVGMDANRYKDKLSQLHNASLSWTEFKNTLFNADADNGSFDLAEPLITYSISFFTDNQRVLFGVFGFIFGYFYSRSIGFLLDRSKETNRKAIYFLIIFALINPFWNINGFRMWTAAWIYFFGVINYLTGNKREGILVASLSVFFHFSFALPLAILLGYRFIGNKILLFYLFYVASLFVAELNMEQVQNVLTNFLPGIFERKVTAYTGEEYVEKVATAIEDFNWYIRYSLQLLKYLTFLFLSIVVFNRKKITDKSLENIFAFSLFFLAISYVMSSVPSGGRFVTIANMFVYAGLFLYSQFSNLPSSFKKMCEYLVPLFIFYIVVTFRFGCDTIGVMAIIGNPVLALFGNVDLALIQLIK